MMRRRSGAAARFEKDNSVTVAVHCCAHSLNLCLKILEDSFHIFRMLLKGLKKINKLLFFAPRYCISLFNKVARGW